MNLFSKLKSFFTGKSGAFTPAPVTQDYLNEVIAEYRVMLRAGEYEMAEAFIASTVFDSEAQRSYFVEYAHWTKHAVASEMRDQAATALQAEAQAVVDRIKARTEAANDVTLIPNDPPSTIRVVIDDKAPRGPEIDPTLKAARKARPTTIVEENGVPTIKPKRPRKPKADQ